MSETTAKAAAYWDSVAKNPRVSRTRWWESKAINRHINAKICGEAIDGIHAGFHRLLGEMLRGGGGRAISVGCGIAHKEMMLLRAGMVQHFDLFEISADRISKGRVKAAEMGLTNRVTFHQSDAFQNARGSYDLVYWNNSLHHMPDAREAIRWSRERLSGGGVFAMDEFVGPSRFQWSECNLEFARTFRRHLADEFVADPRDASREARPIGRPTLEGMLAMDPSEAADSDSIVPGFLATFPSGTIRYTGGAIYHLALNDILANLGEDSNELRAALHLDDALSMLDENHYAVGLAIKD